MESQLEQYRKNQEKLVQKYNGQIIAVKDGKFLGSFPSKTEALQEMMKKYVPGEFLIIKCTQGDEEYTRRFHSRAVIKKDKQACPA